MFNTQIWKLGTKCLVEDWSGRTREIRDAEVCEERDWQNTLTECPRLEGSKE